MSTLSAPLPTTSPQPTAPPTSRPAPIHPGLEGVVLAETSLSHVDGARGVLLLRGRSVEEIAPRFSFEETVVWLWTGREATADEGDALRRELARRAAPPAQALELLGSSASPAGRPTAGDPMARLRLAVDCLELIDHPPVEEPALEGLAATDLPPDQARLELGRELGVLARMPALVALAAHGAQRGDRRSGSDASGPDTSSPDAAGLAGALLVALGDREPSPARVRALDTYLGTVIDHGCNASTFAARVVTSTGAGLVPSLVAAIGALGGPLHGGAPGPALDLLHDIGRPERAEEVLGRRLDAGERLMGFGHRVYAVRDPRAAVLGDAVRALAAAEASDAGRLLELTRTVEEVAVRLLDERKPDRRLRANVELYTALLLDALGLEPRIFSTVFALARTAGWIAHRREQRAEGRLIRPRLRWREESRRRS